MKSRGRIHMLNIFSFRKCVPPTGSRTFGGDSVSLYEEDKNRSKVLLTWSRSRSALLVPYPRRPEIDTDKCWRSWSLLFTHGMIGTGTSWSALFERHHESVTFTRNTGISKCRVNSVGSRGEFVAIAKVQTHPWFYCCTYQVLSKKCGWQARIWIDFATEGAF